MEGHDGLLSIQGEQVMHSSDNRGDDKALLKVPSVGAILDNIPGGQVNLLPASVLKDPLRVDIPMWFGSSPAPGEPEHLYLYWNNVKVAEKTWTAPVPPGDLFLMVEPRYLNAAGTYPLHYEVMTHNGAWASSDPLTLTITSSPALGDGGGRLLFDAEVASGGVTAQYLEAHGDKVLAEVPPYSPVWPGDTLSWYWDQRQYTDEWVDSRTLTEVDIGKAILLTFEGEMIRDRGEGDRFVHYRIENRAGNQSDHSRFANVQVVPAARDLPWPVVDGATGTGKDVVLDPFDAEEGATVVIADTVVIKPNEQLWVQWGEPGSLGAFRTASPVVAGTRRYKIPKREIALNIGKALPVYYEAVGPDGPLRSEIRQLSVMALDLGKLPLIQCSHVVYQHGQAVLNWKDIPLEGVKLTLKPWPLMMLDQHIRIVVWGPTIMEAREWVAVHKRPLAAQELTAGIFGTDNLTVPKSWLADLIPDQGFVVSVYVSFDSGVTWPDRPNFPMLHVVFSV
jgi:hypothetical protein